MARISLDEVAQMARDRRIPDTWDTSWHAVGKTDEVEVGRLVVGYNFNGHHVKVCTEVVAFADGKRRSFWAIVPIHVEV